MEVNNGMPTSCAIALGCAAIHFNKMLTPFIDVCITDKERVRDNDYNSRCVQAFHLHNLINDIAKKIKHRYCFIMESLAKLETGIK